METGSCRPNRSDDSSERPSPYVLIIRSKLSSKPRPERVSPALLRILLHSGFGAENRFKQIGLLAANVPGSQCNHAAGKGPSGMVHQYVC